MAYVICEKWFNSQLLEEIPKIPPQSLGQLSVNLVIDKTFEFVYTL